MAFESKASGRSAPSSHEPCSHGRESLARPYLGQFILGSEGEHLHVDFHRWLDFGYDLAEEFADLVAEFEEDSPANLTCYLDARLPDARTAA